VAIEAEGFFSGILEAAAFKYPIP